MPVKRAECHTSYLSWVSRVAPVEKNLSCGEICPHDRFPCGQILHITDCHMDKFLTRQIVMWKKSSTWEMWRKFVMWRNNVYNLWRFVAFYAVLLQNLLLSDLRCFVAKSVLSRFTHFCVETKLSKKFARGEKVTNMRYAVALFYNNPPLRHLKPFDRWQQ